MIVSTPARALCAVLLAIAAAGCEAGTLLSAQSGRTSTSTSTVPLGETPAAPSAVDSNAVIIPTPSANGNLPTDGNVPANANVPAAAPTGPGIAIYWGTGNSSGKDPNLATVCATPQYSIIIMSFANAIAGGSRNGDGYPETQISGCSGSQAAPNQYLQNCNNLAGPIAACQAAGKKVILSLGGGGASVGFHSDAEGQAYANLLWDLVLGGTGAVRPFGSATLDGIDLDVESGSAVGYGAFVLALRAKMDADTRKKYIITAAPQCVFPDAWMGPGVGTALTMAPNAFDHLFVQFYNNYCHWADRGAFDKTYAQWSGLATAGKPKIWVGLVPTDNAAAKADLVPVSGLPALVQAAAAQPSYGGIMLWDAGYDIIDAAPGAITYSASAAAAHAGLPARAK